MRWQPGQSGNPRGNAGRPPLTAEGREAQRLAMDSTLEAVRRLAQLMAHEDPHVALKACIAILDRGLGKPALAVEVKSEGDSSNGDIASLPRAERIARLEAAQATIVAALAVEREALD